MERTELPDASGTTPGAGDVCAVMVTFHPDAGLPERMERIAAQVGAAVIVDNGSRDEAPVRAAADRLDGARVLWNGRNLGLGAALNLGIRAAQQEGYGFVLLLDQDTTPWPPMTRTLLDAYREAAAPGPVALVGSRVPDDRVVARACSDGRAWIDQEAVITSGSLIPLSQFEAVGPFREDFFVDYVDVEWCLRARALGRRVVTACRPAMDHPIGSPRRHGMLYRQVTASHHPASRRYSITRNRMVVWRTYARTERRYVARDAMSFLKELVKLLLYEDDRRSKAGAVIRGVRDGLAWTLGDR